MRLELIHPMLVHFPLALLLAGTGLRAVAFIARRSSFYRSLLFTSRLILAIGICFAWSAVLAGEIAADIVEKTLCRPQVLEIHSTLAYTASFLFTGGLIIDWGREWRKLSRFQRWMMVLSSLLFLAGTAVLLSVGFFGGSLVYDQGAAVQKQCP